jgi:hypothetical protein
VTSNFQHIVEEQLKQVRRKEVRVPNDTPFNAQVANRSNIATTPSRTIAAHHS